MKADQFWDGKKVAITASANVDPNLLEFLGQFTDSSLDRITGNGSKLTKLIGPVSLRIKGVPSLTPDKQMHSIDFDNDTATISINEEALRAVKADNIPPSLLQVASASIVTLGINQANNLTTGSHLPNETRQKIFEEEIDRVGRLLQETYEHHNIKPPQIVKRTNIHDLF